MRCCNLQPHHLSSSSFLLLSCFYQNKQDYLCCALNLMMAVTLTILVTLLSVLSTASCARMVGGKTEIADVKTNKEVQELGRFAVEEYNRGPRLWRNDDGGDQQLKFAEVVEAQKQVVSGMKYYLTISTTLNGVHRMFGSVVVVKPWLHSKHLLDFGPSSSFQ